MQILTSSLVVATLLASCTAVPPPPRSVTQEGSYEGPSATTPARPSSTPSGRTPRGVVVEQGDGEVAARAQRVFAPLPRRIEECSGGVSGALTVRIVGADGATRVNAATGSSLQGSTRRCIIEALSSVDLDDLPSRASPSNRPSGYSVLLRVEY